jgi:uncharacterized protein GlcG (DUF336 family)
VDLAAVIPLNKQIRTDPVEILTLNQASSIVDSALACGERMKFEPLCVVVLDQSARPLALKRNERASIGRSDIATAKAAGCLEMGLGGRELFRRSQAFPSFIGALTQVLRSSVIPVPGGVLIRGKDGSLLGAVGVSGDTADNDELCAVAGIEAIGLVPDTGALKGPA